MKLRKLMTLFVLFPVLVYGTHDESDNNNTTSGKEGNTTEQVPPGPPVGVENEVENAESPVNQQLEALKDQLETVTKQRNEILEDLNDTKEDLEELEDDFRAANNTIQSLLTQRSLMAKDIDEMEDILNKGPGSLFKGWVWSPDLGWVYISPTIVPYAFSQTEGWMFYDTGSNPRRVYYYTTKKWKVLDTENGT
jgi:hypothetical protein